MIQLLSFVEVDHDLPFHILAILRTQVLGVQFETYHEDWRLIRAAIAVLDRRVLSPLWLRQFDINLARWARNVVEESTQHF